ncbi:helix-turn-helix transcriptional regulator [Ralstonia pseudosolanacearum]|uniref:Helix-turn-helix transcriptional regulator n=1 Tax=Ralstonia solanacearum TaxID=305 RepID=A0AA92K0X2_RALSL|nr:helix-turn-helix transcriptional regulator [Ralstonia pseudosolanacearum]QOK96382.1 helix-turn-helix transcriptional regulator [Ralstonia pseudosolanacearum]
MQINAIEHCLAAAEAVQNIDEFKAWVRNHVGAILKNQCMVCSHGRITSAGVLMDHIVTVDFPIEYLAAIQNVAGGIDTPLMRRWFATRSPVYFDAAAPAAETDRVWLAKFIMHDLRNAVADGIYDEGHCIGTYFSFHRLPSINAPFLTSILRDLTPVLHRTLMRAVADTEKTWHNALRVMSLLSERERQVAAWIGKGKSNAEIALLASISENTVKQHLKHIMDKTGCANRVGVAVLATWYAVSPLGQGMKVL